MSTQGCFRLSRRVFLEAGLTACAGSLLAPALPAAEPAGQGAREPPSSPLPLITKTIPGSGEKLPAIGLGTDSFRTSVRDDIRAEIERMSELGGSVIDTSDDYGDSEILIGEALGNLGTREKLFLATKCSNGPGSFETSLERLKIRRVDLLQVHNLHSVAELLPIMQGWKKAGRIRYVGITTSRVSQHAEMAQMMRSFPLDFIQVDYSIANRDAAETILPLALERRLAVLVNLPFAHSTLFRRVAGRPLPPWAADIDVASWAQYFLKYVIAHPAVTCAIPGSTKVSHLEDNQRGGRGRLPDEATRRKMEQYWDSMAS